LGDGLVGGAQEDLARREGKLLKEHREGNRGGITRRVEERKVKEVD